MAGRFNWSFPGWKVSPFDFKKKDDAINFYCMYMYDRVQSMFEYKGLPDSLPARMIELYLQMAGHVIITSYGNNDGTLHAFTGGLGGEKDIYYMPTVAVVANPALKDSADLKINEDCIVISNDSLYMGLQPMFSKYATLLAETDVSIRVMLINSRISSLISAADDRTQKSAKMFLEDIEDGKLGIIASSDFLEGIKAQPYMNTGSNRLTDLIEIKQYLQAAWFNDLGLQANYNMKREAINSNEAQLNEDALLPLIDDMLTCRKNGIEKVNAMYGTDISVEFSSSWKNNLQEISQILNDDTPDDPDDTQGGDNDEM